MRLNKQVLSFESGIDARRHPNILPIKNAEMMYNYDVSSGALVALPDFIEMTSRFTSLEWGSGIASLFNFDKEVIKAFYFKRFDFENNCDDDKLLFVTSELKLLYVSLFDEHAELVDSGIEFSSVPSGVQYRLNSEDVFIMASPTDDMVVWDGTGEFETIVGAPKITSMAVHFERLFVTTAGGNYELWFSDDLDPTNWNVSLEDAGLIEMCDERGALRKVVSFNNYLYIFRDYGISRLSASGGQEGFYLTHLFVSSGKIFEDTICVCGDRIIFASADGVYSFDGLSTTKILTSVFPIFNLNDKANSAYFAGKYYLSLKIDYNDSNYTDSGSDVNSLFVYDVKEKTYTIFRGASIVSMVSLLSPFYNKICFINSTGAVSGRKSLVLELGDADDFLDRNPVITQKRLWRSALSDSNYPGEFKTIRKVHVYSSNAAVLTIRSENEVITINLTSGINSYPCIISGRRFGFEFYSENRDSEISDFLIEIY